MSAWHTLTETEDRPDMRFFSRNEIGRLVEPFPELKLTKRKTNRDAARARLIRAALWDGELSQSEIARQHGVSRQTVSMYAKHLRGA